jgi:hypothetical protein
VKSYQYSVAVRKHSALKGLAKYVLMILATYVDDSGECYPSYATLVNDSGLSLTGIRKAIGAAVQSGELKVVAKGRATGCSTKYRIALNYVPIEHSPDDNCVSAKHSHEGDCVSTKHSTMSPQDTNYVSTRHLTNHELAIKLPKARKRAAGSSSVTTSKNGTMDPQIPPVLQTSAFLKAWEDFDDYRKKGKARKEWTPRAKAIALSTCSNLGPDVAVTAIERSIMSGWTGIFAPNNHEQKPKRATDEFGFPNL